MVEILEDQDLLEFKCDIFCHQVNCQGRMGSGIAKQIRNKYPIVFEEYSTFCKNCISAKNLLGKCQIVEINDNLLCANLFGQLYYGQGGIVYTNYSALYCAFMNLRDYCSFDKNKHWVIGIPYNIGCGLAGGNWNKVYKMILEIFESCSNIDIKICKI